MMNKIMILLLTIGLVQSLYAESDASFPDDWESWTVFSEGAIPGSAVPVGDDLPAIVAETFKTYNWVNEGHGSEYELRFNPEKKGQKPNFDDGGTAVLNLTDIKVLLVTEHFLGDPVYGAFTYDGKDISDAHPSLSVDACVACHTGYGEACVNGICNNF